MTNFSTSDIPDAVLQELSDALADGFVVERINKRSVRVTTANADIDVVPVVEWGAAYQLPDRDLGRWRGTNPPGHIAWSHNQNILFEGRFKPLVKLFKWWRRENPTGKRPKGFVLEALVSRHAPIGECHYGEALTQMLESIYASYGQLAALGIKPSIDDPSLAGNDVLSKVSLSDWQNFIERVRVHAGFARRAQEEDDMEEATRLWRRLFGNRFRSTSNPAKAASLASYAVTAPAARPEYRFPDEPANPNSPRTFA